jgi:putative thioredoxin
MAIDVTEATFEAEVLERSRTTPVVIDFWAEWCGPCKTLTPILEKVVGETGGRVVLAKVNVDENQGLAQAFQIQSIPTVIIAKDGQLFQGFMGAVPEQTARQLVQSLLPTDEEQAIARLVAAGDETSLRQALALAPGDETVVLALAELLVRTDRGEEALALLARIPETDEVRHIAALARVGTAPTDDYDDKLGALLPRVKDDEEARQEFLDILELMGPLDPRTASYRKQLTSRLF